MHIHVYGTFTKSEVDLSVYYFFITYFALTIKFNVLVFLLIRAGRDMDAHWEWSNA